FMSPIWVLLENSPLVFRLPPNQVGRAGFTFDATKNVPYRTNSDGFRDREPGEKRPGVPRVVVLGDSYVFGWAVLEAETFPTRALAPRPAKYSQADVHGGVRGGEPQVARVEGCAGAHGGVLPATRGGVGRDDPARFHAAVRRRLSRRFDSCSGVRVGTGAG